MTDVLYVPKLNNLFNVNAAVLNRNAITFVYKHAKQKQAVAVKKGAAEQSRINTITEYDW